MVDTSYIRQCLELGFETERTTGVKLLTKEAK